jgi:crotonobetainyl-CoA:carnitine CoA-transferase CaiB-like acyl-CoA transferase
MKTIEEQPFNPYWVLDLSNEGGMVCGKILSDLGATVIKVEKPAGDPARDYGPFYHNMPDKNKSLFWFAYNTGKRSITLDIETSDGKKIFKRLVELCDVVIETFPPSYMARLGLGYSVLSSINLGTILVSITPFGQTGPYSAYECCDLVALATGGLMYATGDPDRAPTRPSIELSYTLVGIQAAMAAMTSLYNRLKTGVGEHIDVSIQECIVPSAWVAPNYWVLNKIILTREGARARRAQVAVKQIWDCKGGYISWRLFTGTDGDKTQALVNWMDAEGMAGELRGIDWKAVDMSEVTQDQIENWEKYWSAFFLSYTKEELYREAVRRGIMIFPVNDFKDLYENEQLKSRNFWIDVAHPKLADHVVYPGSPFKSEDGWWEVKRPPRIGEHNEEVYKELGYSKEQLELLKARHVI